ncbi:putative ribonuclease H-like domain-containing protein [Tanacetum coccineum]
MNQFCEMKGIKREFSVARTPQQNGVAKRRNRTLIEAAAKTMVMAEKKIEPEQDYILIPICTTDPLISQDPKVSKEDAEEKATEMDESGASDKDGTNSVTLLLVHHLVVAVARSNHLQQDAPYNTPVKLLEALMLFSRTSTFKDFSFKNALPTPHIVSNVTLIDDTRIFGNAYDDEDVGAEADLNNLETTLNVSPIPTTIIDKDHPKDQIIRDFNSAIQTRRMTKISDEHAMIASTPMEPNKALIKDEEANITPKMSHLHAVKRIFRYLKVNLNWAFGILGIHHLTWKLFLIVIMLELSFENKKSTTRGCQFLGKRLISWQCNKQTIVANSATKAEYVDAAN